MSLSPEEVRHVAHLARLRLSEAEALSYAHQLSTILDYFQHLGAAPTEDVPPTMHPLPLNNVLREDIPGSGCGVQAAICNAPDADQGFFRVPRILGTGEA